MTATQRLTIHLNDIEVRQITAEETHPLRLSILRTGLPPESARFNGDESPSTIHFGAFYQGELLSIASLVREIPPEIQVAQDAAPKPGAADWRLRGMASATGTQGQGLGSSLIRACVRHVRAQGGSRIWCYARIDAVEFYLKQGFHFLSDSFDIPGVGPHRTMSLDA